MIGPDLTVPALGPCFAVRSAADLWGIEYDGWIVTLRSTGHFIYTGRVMTPHAAAARLIEHERGGRP